MSRGAHHKAVSEYRGKPEGYYDEPTLERRCRLARYSLQRQLKEVEAHMIEQGFRIEPEEPTPPA